MVEESGELRIEHVFPSDAPFRFANHFVVQFDHGAEYRLLFFEIEPPFVLGDQEEQQSKLQAMRKIEARCVARVIISAARMPEIAAAMLENLKNNAPDQFTQIVNQIGQPQAKNTKP